MKGWRDVYIGRGDKQLGLAPSYWGNPFRIGRDGDRKEVVTKFQNLVESGELMGKVRGLKGNVLLCHCRDDEECHGDVLVNAYVEKFGINTGQAPADQEIAAAVRQTAVAAARPRSLVLMV